jgi:hypothetical protein
VGFLAGAAIFSRAGGHGYRYSDVMNLSPIARYHVSSAPGLPSSGASASTSNRCSDENFVTAKYPCDRVHAGIVSQYEGHAPPTNDDRATEVSDATDSGLTMAAIVALAAAGCATRQVSRRRGSMSRNITPDWGPADALPTLHARLKGPFFQDHGRGRLRRRRARDSSRPRPNTGPLIHQHEHLRADRRNRIDRAPACYGTLRRSVVGIQAGTLVVDVIDARRTG